MASLLEYDEENWTATIKWDSTKKNEDVSLDLIDAPVCTGSLWNPNIDNSLKSRPTRGCQTKKMGSIATSVKEPVIARMKRKIAQVDNKKLASTPRQKARQKTVVSLSTTSSHSWSDECKKKNFDLRELFDLPKEGDFLQRELNVGFVDALLRTVKTHEDADEAQR